MSVREGEESVKQNDNLTFLTLVATFVLPFNAVAAVLAIQTRYGPENEDFWVFWLVSICAWGCIWVVFWFVRWVKRPSRERVEV
jgi:Mg2+ and Co2+ transporter CorA